MSDKKSPVPAPVNLEKNTAPLPAVKNDKAETAVTLPPTTPAPTAKGKAKSITCEPGKPYTISIVEGTVTKVLTFTLPKNVTEKQEVTIASSSPNWLGRDGVPLRAHICASEHGVVILQPHLKGWKANAFPGSSITIA